MNRKIVQFIADALERFGLEELADRVDSLADMADVFTFQRGDYTWIRVLAPILAEVAVAILEEVDGATEAEQADA